MVVTAACCLLALVQVGSPDRPVRTIVLSLRATASAGETVELEVRNVSAEPVDTRGQVTLMMFPLDRTKHPLYDGLLSTSVDPNTGQFDGFFAERPSPRLVLGAGEARTVHVRLRKLKWSLSPNWVWQPRELWELAGAGEYELMAFLHVDLSPPEHPLPQRIHVRIAGP